MAVMNTNNISPAEAARRLHELEPLSDDMLLFARTLRRTMLPGGDFESDTDHTVHLMVMAIAYALKYRPELDLSKLAVYGLVHDMVEIYAGDTPTYHSTDQSLREKYQRESEALAKLRQRWAAFPGLLAWVERYESLADDEAKFIKSFDKLAPGFLHVRCKGKDLRELRIMTGAEHRQAASVVDQKMFSGYGQQFPDILAMREASHDWVEGVLDDQSM